MRSRLPIIFVLIAICLAAWGYATMHGGLFAAVASGPDGPEYIEYWDGVACSALDPATYTTGDKVDCLPSAAVSGTVSGTLTVGYTQNLYWSGTYETGLHVRVNADADYDTVNNVCGVINTGGDGVTFEVVDLLGTGLHAAGYESGNKYSIAKWSGGLQTASDPITAVYTIYDPSGGGCTTYNSGVPPTYVPGDPAGTIVFPNDDSTGSGCSTFDMGCWLTYLFVPTSLDTGTLIGTFNTAFPFSVVVDMVDGAGQLNTMFASGLNNGFACQGPYIGTGDLSALGSWGGNGIGTRLPVPSLCTTDPPQSDLVNRAGDLFGYRRPIRAALTIGFWLSVLWVWMGVFGLRTGAEPDADPGVGL